MKIDELPIVRHGDVRHAYYICPHGVTAWDMLTGERKDLAPGIYVSVTDQRTDEEIRDALKDVREP